MENIEMEEEGLMAEMGFKDPSSIVIKIKRKLPDFLQSVKLKYVGLGYWYTKDQLVYNLRAILILLPIILFAALIISLDLFQNFQFNPKSSYKAYAALSALLCSLYFTKRSNSVFLVDFSCCKPDDTMKITNEEFLDMTECNGAFEEDTVEFQKRIARKSGLGDETYLPPSITVRPPDLCLRSARTEAETVMFDALDSLFKKTGIKATDIDILIVNCSLFNPFPSLSSMIVNHYKMRTDIKSFNLGGMGCSAGLISIDLAKNLLKANPNSYAVVVSTENVTLNWYFGNDRSMLLCNCLFRIGAAAVLLSNHQRDKRRSKYQLLHIVRSHKGGEDKSYNCVYQREDDKGKLGVSLSRDLMAVAGDALKTNITTLGPLVLPLKEQFKFFVTLVMKKVLMMKVKPYIPNFKKAFEHFCVHAGGRGVLEAIQKNLHLTDKNMEPSKMTLHRFGNTSSSSIWYELAYTEAKGGIQRGDRVWQIAFGSGFKCNSAVWKALRNVDERDLKKGGNPWMDCIAKYPVKVMA